MIDKDRLLSEAYEERDTLKVALEEERLERSFEEYDWALNLNNNLIAIENAKSSLESATVIDNELVRVAYNCALADSEISLEDIKVSNEADYHDPGTRMTTWEVVKATFKFMANIFKKIIGLLQSLYATLFNSALALANHNDKLNDLIREKASSKVISNKTRLGREISLVTVDGSRPRRGADLIATSRTIHDVLRVCLKYHSRNLINVGEDLIREFNRVEFKNEDNLKPFITALEDLNLNEIGKSVNANVSVSKDSRWSSEGVLTRTPTLGGEKALFFYEAPYKEGDTGIAKLNKLFRQDMKFTDVTQVKGTIREDGEMDTMTINNLKEIYEINKSMIRFMADYKKDQKEMDKKAAAIFKVTENVQNKSEKDAVGGDTTSKMISNFNNLMAVQKHYATWMKDPYANLLKHIFSYVRANINICRKHLDSYE